MRPHAFRIVSVLGLLLGLQPAAWAQQPASPPPRGVHYLVLIRHGHYTADRDSTVDDVVANGLDSLGREQARLVGARLAGWPVKPASLVASTYRRARETAEEMAPALRLRPTLDSLIHECTADSDRPDIMRGTTVAEAAACDSNLSRAWAKYFVPSPATDRHDILVCHGNVIRWFVSRALTGQTRRWAWMDIGNASITVIAVRPDGSTRLVCFSDVGHLPVPKQTWLSRGPGFAGPPQR